MEFHWFLPVHNVPKGAKLAQLWDIVGRNGNPDIPKNTTTPRKTKDKEAFYDKALGRSYVPTKFDMSEDVSVPVTPDRLAQAVIKGGASRRKD